MADDQIPNASSQDAPSDELFVFGQTEAASAEPKTPTGSPAEDASLNADGTLAYIHDGGVAVQNAETPGQGPIVPESGEQEITPAPDTVPTEPVQQTGETVPSDGSSDGSTPPVILDAAPDDTDQVLNDTSAETPEAVPALEPAEDRGADIARSEEHTSELQSH